MSARDGDWLFTPFQCEHCWFGNLFKCEPNRFSESDQRMLAMMRRVNLDLFWSREASTFPLGEVKRILDLWKGRINYNPLPIISPWSEDDELGIMGVAITILEHSLEKGRLADYVQFEA